MIEAKYQGKSAATKLLIGMCVMVPREVFGAFGLLDESMVLGADDLELSWRLRTAGMKLVIALDTFVHHIGRAGSSQRPPEEIERLIAESDAALVAKLERFDGPNVPSSTRLWASTMLCAGEPEAGPRGSIGYNPSASKEPR